MAVDHYSFSASVTCEVVQDCSRMFSLSSSSNMRIILLSIINKLDANSELLTTCSRTVNDNDVETIIVHLQKQSLIPTFDLLCLLDLAAQYEKIGECHEVLEILNSVTVDEIHQEKIKAVIQSLLLAPRCTHLHKTLSIDGLLSRLTDHLRHFKSVVTNVDISTRQPFVVLQESLNDLEQTISHLGVSLPRGVAHRLNDLLLDAINDLLPGRILFYYRA